jgi:hypothetical protein
MQPFSRGQLWIMQAGERSDTEGFHLCLDEAYEVCTCMYMDVLQSCGVVRKKQGCYC